ncbi:hypothetical protein [Enterocloster clostridioformis]|uniref:Uncharacterized protein n=1 Tax=Enterocloster clostridioformis TaxID=1531 RepID=A0AAP9M4C0_9FIRM|nr:hypothetical protein [Enterocloster clostridioformis]EHG33518.1 hypothetical protein HMPREF9467_00723 [ [[Clostridium] clostridioforme 2_1_49FAA]QIX93856.1 hypothetical protein FOC47_26920 [Enterocloster clostridioformis]
MYNITFNNNRVLKIYDSQENKSTQTLIIRINPSDYLFSDINNLFDNLTKNDLKRIIKTTPSASYITTYENYTDIVSRSIDKVTILVKKAEEIPSFDEDGQDITASIVTNEPQEIELIVVVLKYEDPTKVIVEQLNQQINPTIDVETCSLDDLKMFVQKKNSDSLEIFLENNPLLYTDGKYYGVSKVDRDEMSQQYLAYQLNKTINPNAEDIVKWHSKGTKCTPMSVSDFSTLALAVYAYTEPYYEEMQTIKESIMSASTKDEVLSIKIFNKVL